MDREEIFYKNRFIQIFRDHWSRFKEYRPEYVSEVVEENVEKMMGCGLLENGYFEYICMDCQQTQKVGFTCKSRFCLRCAKVYIDNWVNKMRGTIFPWVSHRHVILTIPDTLWEHLHNDAELLKKVGDCGVKTIKEVMKISNKGEEIEPGIIGVIQTSGRASTWNPHLHFLVTEGGLDRRKSWNDVIYMDYRTLRMKWMYHLLKVVREHFEDDEVIGAKVDEVYRRRAQQGLIVRAKRERVRRTDLVGYLVKYVVSPPIALSRIRGYDGEWVSYWYREHPTDKRVEVKVSAFEFIRRMVQHIMPKQFKVVRHYGLYARNKVNRVREVLRKTFEGVKEGVVEGVKGVLNQVVRAKNYRERMIESFGRDPLRCARCGQQMELWAIWHPRYGYIYDFCRDRPEAIGGEKSNVGEEKGSGAEFWRYEQLCLPIV